MPIDSKQTAQESQPTQNDTTNLKEVTVSVVPNTDIGKKLYDVLPAKQTLNKDGQFFSCVINLSDTSFYWANAFFVPSKPCRVIEISILAQGNATNGGTMTLDFQKLGNGSSNGGGNPSLLTTPFNLKTGALSRQVRRGTDLNNVNCVLERNQNLSLYTTGGGLPTNVLGCCITINFVYLGEGDYNDVI
jgi:hypothetical protein